MTETTPPPRPPPPSSSTSSATPPTREERSRDPWLAELRRRVRAAQNAVAERLGVSGRDRVEIVSEMLSRHEEDRVSYWLRIVLALGIATLGLVLDSTGVVIGAMLISPLMEPIVALGMGLAVGSPYLTLRASVRLSWSVVVVTGSAALLTLLLPFHTMTREIAARTSPTLIDLSVAAFCALAAGFTTVRRSSDTAAAAAGTAIGIALVPPVCVIGYGLGIGELRVAGGASLLFVANLSAIVFVTIALFVLLGFDTLDIRRLESTEVRATTRVARVASRLRRAFGTRYGDLLRFLLPALLLAVVYVPLRSALAEVAWKVRVQGEVERAIASVAPPGLSVRTAVSVEGHAVTIRLVIVGSSRRAREIEEVLRTDVAAAAGVVPSVDVLAVPDHETLQAVAHKATVPEKVAAIAAPVAARPDLEPVRAAIEGLLSSHWSADAGEIVQWYLSFDPVEGPQLTVVHTGAPIGALGRDLLADAITDLVDAPVQVVDRPIALGTWAADPDEVTAWLPDLAHALAIAEAVDGVRACVTRGPSVRHVAAPVPATPSPPADEAGETGEAADLPAPAPAVVSVPDPGALAAEALLAEARAGVTIATTRTAAWSVVLTRGSCPSGADPGGSAAAAKSTPDDDPGDPGGTSPPGPAPLPPAAGPL